MLIDTISGYETFDGYGTIKINAFKVNPGRNEGDMPLFAAEKDTASLPPAERITKTMNNVMFASTANKNHGQWFVNRWNVPEGTIIKIVASKRSPGLGFAANRAIQMFIRVRTGAPVQTITFHLTGAPSANITRGRFVGMFDILPIEHFLQFKLNPPESTLHQFLDVFEENEDWITLDVDRPAQSAYDPGRVEVIPTVKGGTVTVTKPTRVRNIRLNNPLAKKGK